MSSAQAPQTIRVTLDTFIRAETDTYLRKRQATGAFGRLVHHRDPVDIDHQPVVRANRDTLYSYGVFDLSEPVTLTLPEPGRRFQSIRIINQDHFIVADQARPGTYALTQESVGSRYVHVNIRTLVTPGDPEDVAAAHALQDAVRLEQASPGSLELPEWNQESLGALRRAILGLGAFVPDSRRMFGARDQVDPVRHLAGTAGGWGGGSEQAVLFINVTPERNDGTTPHQLRVAEVPVDGFWSISVYNAAGYFESNPHGGYSLNNLTAKPGPDGAFLLQFGGSPDQANWLHISPGWNYTVRLYLPRQEVLEGRWQFPAATPVES